MMIIESEKWGEITYSETEIVNFPHGIPGFSSLTQYVIVAIEETPFFCMQSLQDNAVSFIVANPFDFFSTYEFDIDDFAKEELKIEHEQDVLVYAIVKINNALEDATINIVAPIVINNSKKIGMQYILPDGQFNISQPLFGPLFRK